MIELLITVVLIALLLSMAVPAFSGWVANARVRSVADALQNGLRLAQAESVKRERQTALVLTNATPALDVTASASATRWYIEVLPSISAFKDQTPVFVEAGSFRETAAGVTIAGNNAVICFNSIGQLTTRATTSGIGSVCTAPTTLATYDVSATGSNRPLRVQVSLGGQVRLCDPSKTLSSTNPDGC